MHITRRVPQRWLKSLPFSSCVSSAIRMDIDSAYVSIEEDTGADRTIFFIRECGFHEQCSASSFKRAGCWSFCSSEAARVKLVKHLMTSSKHQGELEPNNRVTLEEANDVADQIEVEEAIESKHDRATYRLGIDQNKERGQKGGKKGDSKGSKNASGSSGSMHQQGGEPELWRKRPRPSMSPPHDEQEQSIVVRGATAEVVGRTDGHRVCVQATVPHGLAGSGARQYDAVAKACLPAGGKSQ
jgi:hypothetical protein